MQWSSGTGLILRARLGADGCKSGMKRLPILLTITTGLALASVLGLNATLESQTNWLQRWLKQKVQREEGAINGAAVAIAATILALDVAIPHRQERQQRPKTNRELSAEDAET